MLAPFSSSDWKSAQRLYCPVKLYRILISCRVYRGEVAVSTFLYFIFADAIQSDSPFRRALRCEQDGLFLPS